MEKSKLIGLLRSFDSKELRAFGGFVASPYFNKNQELVRLYSLLKKTAPKGFPTKEIAKKRVYRALFPAATYEERLLNHLMSLLLKLGEQFIGLRQFEEAGIIPCHYILNACIDRHLEKQYSHLYKKAVAKLEHYEWKDESYFFQKFLLAEIAEKHFSSKNIRRYDKNIQEASDNFDIYFLSKKLKYLCAMLDRQKIIPVAYRSHMMEEVKRYLADGKFGHIPAVSIYLKLLLTLTEEKPEVHFTDFRGMLKTHATSFSSYEMKELYYFAINFCIHKIRNGEKQFTDDLMELYREGIDEGFLLEDGNISPWTYKNMVKLALGLKRFNWVEDFVTGYSSKLAESEREDAFHFNLADLYYHKKDYDKALYHLNQVEFSDIHYNLGAKAMLLKIYFENKETEAFLSLIPTFKIFLKRNELVSKNVKESYFNFITLLYQIFKYGRSRYPTLKEKIRDTHALNGRSWLLQQLEALN